jgi:hypothetical protein
LDDVAVEHVHPIRPLEAIGQPLRLLDVAQPKESIVELQVRHLLLVHLSASDF